MPSKGKPTLWCRRHWKALSGSRTQRDAVPLFHRPPVASAPGPVSSTPPPVRPNDDASAAKRMARVASAQNHASVLRSSSLLACSLDDSRGRNREVRLSKDIPRTYAVVSICGSTNQRWKKNILLDIINDKICTHGYEMHKYVLFILKCERSSKPGIWQDDFEREKNLQHRG